MSNFPTSKKELFMKSSKPASTARPAQLKRPLISQRGYSIIELSIALAILAVIIIGGLLGVQSILRNNRTNDLLKNLPLIMASAEKITNSAPSLTAANGVSTANLAALNVFPPNLVNGGTVNNEHGGTTQLEGNTGPLVAGGQTVAPAGGSFVLTYSGIPTQSCADVVVGIAPLALVVGVTTGTTSGNVTPVAGIVKSLPVGTATGVIDLGTLAGVCGAVGSKIVTAVMPRG
jgi:prepilin-type N-terminal cleavage/methylation domain-containing protein